MTKYRCSQQYDNSMVGSESSINTNSEFEIVNEVNDLEVTIQQCDGRAYYGEHRFIVYRRNLIMI